MKISVLFAGVWATCCVPFGLAQTAPNPPNQLCNLETVYDSIKTGNVVDVTLEVRYRHCPSNTDNLPCRVASTDPNQGFAPGPLLDGVESQLIMINDSSPGPTIRAKLGDTVRVTVVNYLQEPTTMHFHGITQFGTPFMDGADGITQCAIAQGYTQTYEFIAHPAGTTFYHSHTGSQRVGGMTGPLIIEDPADDESYDDKVVFFQDWFHDRPDSAFNFWAENHPGNCITFGGNQFTGNINPGNAGIPFVGAVVGDGMLFQSFVVNGEGIYEYQATQIPDLLGGTTFQEMGCPGQTADPPQCQFCLNEGNWTSEPCKVSSDSSTCGSPHVIEVTADKPTRLRFIHGGSLFAAQVCIDGHEVQIIAADGSPVEPYTTGCFIIFSAERYDVLISPEAVGDYWVRFSTLEQQTAASFGDSSDYSNIDEYSTGFPHFGYAILRVTESPGEALPSDYEYLISKDPISCNTTDGINCGSDYWLTAKTLGCSVSASRMDPSRCVTSFDALKPASSPNDDASICGSTLMAHQVAPDLQATVSMGFLPDEVPRWDGLSMNARIELMLEKDWGFPYRTPTDPAEWGSHQPISFVSPDSPPLSLDSALREEIYARRMTFREINPENPLGPDSATPYPTDYARGVLGTNAMMANYGDVVRIYFNCVEPFGAACAMPHPMHLHGYRVAVLYVGEWNETYDESKLNLENPVYRDTVTVYTDSFVVIQFAAINPGAWRWHCHVDIHHRGGMAFLLDVGGDDAVEALRATPESAQMCAVTQDYSAGYDSFSTAFLVVSFFSALALMMI